MNGLRTAFLAALLFLTTARACPAGPLDRVRQAFVDVSVMSYAPDGEATERFVRRARRETEQGLGVPLSDFPDLVCIPEPPKCG